MSPKTSIAEWVKLIGLNLYISIRNTRENLQIIWRYWRKPRFMHVDIGLFLTYFFDNPFKISKRFLSHSGEKNLYQYGETPLTTLEAIMIRAGVTKEDVVYELGAGTGRTSFWLSQFYGCRTIGIEQIPAFVTRAQRLVKSCKLERVTFKQEDFTECTFPDATVIYLYGTCLSEESLDKLVPNMAKLPKGTKIITVSYPLTTYDSDNSFEIMRVFSMPFTWGETEVFLHLVK